jgi:hypothetical protein
VISNLFHIFHSWNTLPSPCIGIDPNFNKTVSDLCVLQPSPMDSPPIRKSCRAVLKLHQHVCIRTDLYLHASDILNSWPRTIDWQQIRIRILKPVRRVAP